jgi:hypothetical protein
VAGGVREDDGVRRPIARPAVAVVAVLGLGAVLAGCGSAAAPSPPSGVDGLEVPTDAPDPADFVSGVDSPWLALDVAASYRTVDDETVDLAVAPGPEVAGVPTTAVTLGGTTDLLAEDDDGNVWWLGRESDDPAVATWLTGEDDVRAGLLVTRTPRVGDGYLAADLPGDDDPRLTVEAVDETLTLDVDGTATEYDDVVVLDLTDLDGTGARAWYARGVGLVLLESAGGVAALTRTPG